MKKLTIFLALTLCAGILSAQTEERESVQNMDYDNYNHWSVELSGGFTKPLRPMTKHYYGDILGFGNLDLNVRYMANSLFGLRLGVGFNKFQDGGDSRSFDTNMYRASLEGVVNAGSLLGFREWSNRVNFLVHGGAGYGMMKYDKDIYDHDDNLAFLTAGITPQLRISNHFSVFADVSGFATIRQNRSFDGNSPATKRGIKGAFVNTSVGIVYSFGGGDKAHADWYAKANETNEISRLRDDVDKIQSDLQDTDRDGVPDYLDEEPNTVNGVAVDSKGRAVDQNNNGIPDEMENSLDDYIQKSITNQSRGGEGSTGNLAKELSEYGMLTVYFKFNSVNFEASSINIINYVVNYLKSHEDASIEIQGFADTVGNAKYNEELSLRRAQKVKDLIIKGGVDDARVEVKGLGEDSAYQGSDSGVRQLMRRATIKIK